MTEVLPTALEKPLSQLEGLVLCRSCGHVITSDRAACAKDGRHEHTFRNPTGYSFHLLCFGEAPGCKFSGPPTDEATWFPGYAWNFALCAGCGTHLGWGYQGKESFVGLIATRVVRPQALVD